MKVVRFDHNTEHALETEFVHSSVANLISVLKNTPVPYREEKSENQKSKSILQPVLNAFIEQELVEHGWDREYRVTGDVETGGMRVDFCRRSDDKLCVVEVQFGNVGRFYGDMWKFLHLQAQGRLALAVHVALTDETAAFTDSGISTYETSVRRVLEVADTTLKAIPVPIICLGLSHQGAELVDFAQTRFKNTKMLQGEGAKAKIHHAVAQLRRGVPLDQVGPPNGIREQIRRAAASVQAALF
ncbi:hypothetical protein WL29_20560 [Burkholderia ubonensis]|uniref:Restriction endonuclease n=1 Tax=Burkholderia ubonensis TaxID=101571 RepID=A0A119HFD4_9BURK|nr:BglII/BstYI family type II restriction endonuclease [Burkholderia ubonensis]KWA83759.1 hypothetical protein WL29_20560 [Burkholderia ubonensis]